MVAWILPLAGYPVAIVGIVKSVGGLNSSKRGWAIAGLVLSIIGLVFTAANSLYGAYLGATGQHPFLPNYRGQ